MSESIRDLLVHGIAAAKGKEYGEARYFLEWALRMDPPLDQQVEAWWYLSEITDDPAERRSLLEQIVVNDPTEPRARRKLTLLNSGVKDSQVINPDRFVNQAADQSANGEAQRFTCPQCGGRMVYEADGQTLSCEYCTARQNLNTASSGPGGLDENDFILALATAKGHSTPLAEHTFICQGCGSGFILAAQNLTQTCPFCQSAYVVENSEQGSLVAPDGLIPFKVKAAQARQALQEWFKEHPAQQPRKVTGGGGIYLPVWCFDLGGQLPWNGQIVEDRRVTPTSGLHLVYQPNVLIPAARHFSPPCLEQMHQFDLAELTPFDPRFLSNWPAETYQITVAEAALDARQTALQSERGRIRTGQVQAVSDFHLNSTGLLVEAYRLLLLPFFITQYTCGEDNAAYAVAINGQSGEVSAESPQNGLGGWLARVMRV